MTSGEPPQVWDRASIGEHWLIWNISMSERLISLARLESDIDWGGRWYVVWKMVSLDEEVVIEAGKRQKVRQSLAGCLGNSFTGGSRSWRWKTTVWGNRWYVVWKTVSLDEEVAHGAGKRHWVRESLVPSLENSFIAWGHPLTRSFWV